MASSRRAIGPPCGGDSLLTVLCATRQPRVMERAGVPEPRGSLATSTTGESRTQCAQENATGMCRRIVRAGRTLVSFLAMAAAVVALFHGAAMAEELDGAEVGVRIV